jgi:hypothetical protein
MAKGLALIQALIQKRQLEYSIGPILPIGCRCREGRLMLWCVCGKGRRRRERVEDDDEEDD